MFEFELEDLEYNDRYDYYDDGSKKGIGFDWTCPSCHNIEINFMGYDECFEDWNRDEKEYLECYKCEIVIFSEANKQSKQ